MKRSLWAGVALALTCASAYAGTTSTAVTVTTVSGNCLAQKNNRSWLTLDASGASANIGYCFGASCTAAIGTAGTTTLAASSLHYFVPDGTPKDAICFIAASGSQPLTIREGFR